MAAEEAAVIEIRELGTECIELIREIDRSESVDTLYNVEGGRIIVVSPNNRIPPCSPGNPRTFT